MTNEGSKPAILIVDDAPENLDLLKSALVEQYKVRPAINGSLALRLALMEPQPDLILLDVMMPDMDGFEVCRQLKRDERTRDIPVIFITAKSGDQDELEGLQMGAVDYITKPISLPIVQARVRTHLALREIGRAMEEKNHRLYEINERLTDSMEQLSASEERFRSLVQTIPDIVYKIDSEGRFTFLNKSIERLGYHQSELIGKHFSEIIHSADVHDASLEKVLERLGRGTSHPNQKLFDERRSGVRMTVGLELRLRTKKGHSETIYELKNIDSNLLSVEVNSTGLYGDVGSETSYRSRQYVGTVGVIRDITDRQKAQNALAEERKLLRQLVDAVPLPIFLFEAEGQLILSNEAFQQFVGIPGDSLDGVFLNELFCLEDQHSVRGLLESLHQDPDADRVHQELTVKAGDDSLRILNVTLLKFHKTAQEKLTIIGVMVDVTEERAFTVQLIQAKKEADRLARQAAEASRAKGDFLANMSHEIRTPLNAVIGLTHLCLQTPLTEQQRDYLAKVGLSANALLQLINDILDFSKIEAGKLTMEKSGFALEKVLGGVATILGIKSQEKGLELLLETRSNVPGRLLGDSHRLGQILTNLAGNAVKFTEKGRVSITTELLEEKTGTVVLQFSVRDTGIGMSAEQVGNLFQEFSQGDSSITRKYGGTGLGLAISKRLVEMMGGQIQVESAPGQGSCFRFTAEFSKWANAPSPAVPIAGTTGQPGSRTAYGDRSRLTGQKVMLVEDNEINQQVAKELLEQVGIQVTIARHGQEAVNLLQQLSVDQVLMDLQMPVMDGLTASRIIRQTLKLAQIPIIAMTANALVGDREKCLAAGMNDHIAKPVVPEELYNTLLKWLPDQGGSLAPRAIPSAADAAQEVEPLFPPIAGVDVTQGMRNVGGNATLYRNLLLKFSQNQGGSCQVIKACLANKDVPLLERTAHTLKGVASTVGALALAKWAGNIEKLSRTPENWDHLPELADAAAIELARVTAAIESNLSQLRRETVGESPTTEAVVSPTDLAPLFQKAVGFLRHFDSAVEAVIQEIAPLARHPARSERLRAIRTALAVYNFEQALFLFHEWATAEGIALESDPS
ncbi:MAG: response regulator [Magnetococcales bacterium]|nr:response regulator [Magnetococcales bacterium]